MNLMNVNVPVITETHGYPQEDTNVSQVTKTYDKHHSPEGFRSASTEETKRRQPDAETSRTAGLQLRGTIARTDSH